MISIIAVMILSVTGISFAQYAPTGPPPDLHMTIYLDEHGYSSNDTITILGHVDQVLLEQDNHTMQIAIYNPNNLLYKSDQIHVSQNGTYSYSFKIAGPIGISGWYNVKIHPISTEEIGIGMMYESTPYYLTIANKTFSIPYAVDYGNITSMSVNPHERSLTINVSNVRFMTLKLPRSLLDSKGDSNNDTPFLVLTNYTKTIFEETGSNNNTRTLKITLPPIKQGYNILVRENAEIKIIGTMLASSVNPSLIPYRIMPPLLQQRSGIAVDEIDCADGLDLVVKADTNTAACIKTNTLHVLLARGWVTPNGLPPNVVCDQNCIDLVEKAGYKCNTEYTAGFYSCYLQNSADVAQVVIPHGASSSDSVENNYEPNKTVVILGINSTVQWQNNDYASSSVTSDWNKFDSGQIIYKHSWTYVFDRPGIYWYHSVPHPWMRGEVIVLSYDDSYVPSIAVIHP
ncbi:MAG TPA: hypothetical protein VJ771_06040 [Candidatus Nitrosotalea sp.]|nr:hypothetical protein [Candidatus Nitrosotalea sp.]